MTSDTNVLRYIIRLSNLILPDFCAMKPSRRLQKKHMERDENSAVLNRDITVVNLSRKQQIKYLKRCLEDKADSDAISSEITLGELKKFYTFMRKKESKKFLGHVLKKLRPAILTQQLKKAEEDKLKLRREAQKYFDELLHANHHFCCPITQDIFVDPVVASDGNTYERHALENWINVYGGNSPITRQPISILCNNDALKHCIDSTRARLESEICDTCKLPKP